MLRLTSIERLYYFDSTPRFPNRISCRLLFAEWVDEARVKEACYFLAQRHSVLNWRINRLNNRLYWDENSGRFDKSTTSSQSRVDPKAEIEASHQTKWFHLIDLDGPPADNPLIPGIGDDHSFEPCMILRRWTDQTGLNFSEVWFSVPHAFCDGAGGVLIANDWLQIYDNLERGVQPTKGLLRLDRDRLVHRNRLGLYRWKFLRLLPFQAIGLFGAFKFVFRKSARYDVQHSGNSKTMEGTDSSDEMTSASLGCWLEQSTLVKLDELVGSQGYNLNARLLGCVFHTLHQWRMQNNAQADPAEWLRVILPINLREFEDRRMEAANKSSLVQIDRKGGVDPGDPDFYRSIQNEISVIQKYKLDRMFLIMIRVIARIPFLLRHVATNRKHRGIAIFTNLGQPFKRVEKIAANEELSIPIEVDFLAPLRHGTPLNFALCRYRKRLRITLHYDPTVVSRSQAADILVTYQKTITHLVHSE